VELGCGGLRYVDEEQPPPRTVTVTVTLIVEMSVAGVDAVGKKLVMVTVCVGHTGPLELEQGTNVGQLVGQTGQAGQVVAEVVVDAGVEVDPDEPDEPDEVVEPEVLDVSEELVPEELDEPDELDVEDVDPEVDEVDEVDEPELEELDELEVEEVEEAEDVVVEDVGRGGTPHSSRFWPFACQPTTSSHAHWRAYIPAAPRQSIELSPRTVKPVVTSSCSTPSAFILARM
jgi:hypothetical protein